VVSEKRENRRNGIGIGFKASLISYNFLVNQYPVVQELLFIESGGKCYL
jgi:hypothetical protein